MPAEEKNDFYYNLKNLNKEFENCDKEVEDLKIFFQSSVNNLLENVKKNSTKLKNNLKNEIIADFLNIQIVAKIADTISSWEKNKQQAIARKTLREKTNDSLLIIVYGKVKAGKSTLGNYIADNYPNSSGKSNFFVFDTTGNEHSANRLQEIEDDSFATKSTECTTSIQGFQIPGLTWIDTPGLMSMTQENGELAKKYIEAADLIIYPMSSDSPGRATDTEEIRDLAKKGKEFLVIITKSDFEDEDEIDGKIVSVLENLSDSDREKQEQWVKSEIKNRLNSLKEEFSIDSDKQLLDDVFSISVAVAENNHENKKKWEQSNLPVLYKKLNKIIKNDALRLKKEQPLKNIKAELKKYISESENESLYKIKEGVTSQIEFLENKIEEVKASREKIEADCFGTIEISVASLIEDANTSETDPKDLASNLSKTVQSEINAYAEDFLKKKLNDVTENYELSFPSYEINDSTLEFKPKKKTIKVTNETWTRGLGAAAVGAGGTAGGIWLGGLIGSAVPGVGNVIGAAVGGFFGGLFGSGAGSAAGDYFTEVKEKEITVGDNKDEVINAAKNEAEEIIKKYVDKIIELAVTQILKPLKDVLKDTEKNIDETLNSINKKVS